MYSNNYEIASSLEGFAMTIIPPSFERRGLRGGSLSWQSGLALTPEKGLNAVRMNPDSHEYVAVRRGVI